MKEINNQELECITGGNISLWTIIGVSALVVFVVGIIDGIVNPRACGS